MASGFEWFADIADHFVDLFHHMTVAIDIFVRHCSSVTKVGDRRSPLRVIEVFLDRSYLIELPRVVA